MRKITWIASAGLFLAAGCATTTMQQVQSTPELNSRQIRRVLVLGEINDPELRHLFEGEFARQWKDRGVEVVPGSDVQLATTTLHKSIIASVAKAQQCDTVLVSRLLKREKYDKAGQRKDPTAQAKVEQETTLEQTWLSPPVSATPYEWAAVETHLYDVATEKLIWSGTSTTMVVGSVSKQIRPFVKTILKTLYSAPKTK